MNEIKIKEIDEIESKHTTEKFNEVQSCLLFLNNKIDYHRQETDQVLKKKRERKSAYENQEQKWDVIIGSIDIRKIIKDVLNDFTQIRLTV